MQTVLLVIHLIVALALVGIILLQKSEGGALGIGGGNGGLGNIFSARGVGNALTRTTAWLALGFFATSIVLTVVATRGKSGNAFDSAVPAATQQQDGGTGTGAPAQAPAESGGAVLPNLGQPQAPQVPTNQ